MKTAILYALIPIIAGFIGWVTNWVAVRMIFRPRSPIHILGLTIHGLIPKRKADLARTIGETVERELISHQDIQKVMQVPGFVEGIRDTLMQKIDEMINRKIGENALLAMLASGPTATTIKNSLRDELQKILPGMLESMFESMESKIDFKAIVRGKIEGFDMARLESIIYGIASRELRAIELYGAVLGFLVGLAQVGLVTLGARL
jgi:uncharacterized membrane protein YheB (UPF0754 family)